MFEKFSEVLSFLDKGNDTSEAGIDEVATLTRRGLLILAAAVAVEGVIGSGCDRKDQGKTIVTKHKTPREVKAGKIGKFRAQLGEYLSGKEKIKPIEYNLRDIADGELEYILTSNKSELQRETESLINTFDANLIKDLVGAFEREGPNKASKTVLFDKVMALMSSGVFNADFKKKFNIPSSDDWLVILLNRVLQKMVGEHFLIRGKLYIAGANKSLVDVSEYKALDIVYKGKKLSVPVTLFDNVDGGGAEHGAGVYNHMSGSIAIDQKNMTTKLTGDFRHAGGVIPWIGKLAAKIEAESSNGKRDTHKEAIIAHEAKHPIFMSDHELLSMNAITPYRMDSVFSNEELIKFFPSYSGEDRIKIDALDEMSSCGADISYAISKGDRYMAVGRVLSLVQSAQKDKAYALAADFVLNALASSQSTKKFSGKIVYEDIKILMDRSLISDNDLADMGQAMEYLAKSGAESARQGLE